MDFTPIANDILSGKSGFKIKEKHLIFFYSLVYKDSLDLDFLHDHKLVDSAIICHSINRSDLALRSLIESLIAKYLIKPYNVGRHRLYSAESVANIINSNESLRANFIDKLEVLAIEHVDIVEQPEEVKETKQEKKK